MCLHFNISGQNDFDTLMKLQAEVQKANTKQLKIKIAADLYIFKLKLDYDEQIAKLNQKLAKGVTLPNEKNEIAPPIHSGLASRKIKNIKVQILPF